MVSYGGGLLDLDRAIRIINYDANENASESEQLEAFKVFFKELFDRHKKDAQMYINKLQSIVDQMGE